MKSFSDKTNVEAKTAIARFLSDMTVVARKTYPVWFERLSDGYLDCFPQSRDVARENLAVLPTEDLYLAGVVALEASKIRQYLRPDESSALLSALADQVDAVGGRPDRMVSDLVFFMIGRIDLETGIEQMKTPYDLVVKILLQKMNFAAAAATKPLLDDVIFRHNLGEPLARGVPAWWRAFSATFGIADADTDVGTEVRAAQVNRAG